MNSSYVPHQPQPPSSLGSPVPPHASEAARLLCAGTYVDSAYRNQVIEELYVHEQRIVAPSLGFDAARVLAHALRARIVEVGWAACIAALWIIGIIGTSGAMLIYLFPGLLLAWGASRRKPAAFLALWAGRLMFGLLLIVTVSLAWLGGRLTSALGEGNGNEQNLDLVSAANARFALFILVAVALYSALQHSHVARVLSNELSPEGFANAASDPAEGLRNSRFQRLKQRIRLEQHAPMIVYHEARPFCGAGLAYDTWVLSVEMRPAEGEEAPRPLSNRTVLEAIRPLLEALRVPPGYAGAAVRDRLRWLEIDECVFLPAEGLSRREQIPYNQVSFEAHRDHAIEEGGEKRRHFLRVRVAGWEEELVVTVYVRVHTQGSMLMLEVAPHVLMPVCEDFKDADRMAHQSLTDNLLFKAARALARVPLSAVRSTVTLSQYITYGWRLLSGRYATALPDGPAHSVRELGAADSGSLFQGMDVDRYLRSVQDRIAYGVQTALAVHGYQTSEFGQKIVNISNGGVHIDSVEGSTFAIGAHARATSTVAGGPQAPSSTPGNNGRGASRAPGGTVPGTTPSTGPRAE